MFTKTIWRIFSFELYAWRVMSLGGAVWGGKGGKGGLGGGGWRKIGIPGYMYLVLLPRPEGKCWFSAWLPYIYEWKIQMLKNTLVLEKLENIVWPFSLKNILL